MAWFLNPMRMWRTAAGVRDVWRGGGPGRVRLDGIGRPEGWILPSSRLDFEIVTRDGRVVEIQPRVPLPPMMSLGYRLAHRLGVPLVSSLDPESFAFDLEVAKSRTASD
jgi:hypothetical protein